MSKDSDSYVPERRWEYKIMDQSSLKGENDINALGRRGWELVAISTMPNPAFGSRFVFKRPLLASPA